MNGPPPTAPQTTPYSPGAHRSWQAKLTPDISDPGQRPGSLLRQLSFTFPPSQVSQVRAAWQAPLPASASSSAAGQAQVGSAAAGDAPLLQAVQSRAIASRGAAFKIVTSRGSGPRDDNTRTLAGRLTARPTAARIFWRRASAQPSSASPCLATR
jgi:hypothetical protein